MNGKLILVSGLSGAGKTTLIAGALERLPELTYLRTVTTRPIRPDEETSHEYTFVSPQEYDALRRASKDWDHTEYGGFSYGADAALVKSTLAAGHNVIGSAAPDLAIVAIMAKLYGAEPITIWIKTPREVAKSRVYNDDIRDARNEDFALGSSFDHIFEPKGRKAEDITAFTALIRDFA